MDRTEITAPCVDRPCPNSAPARVMSYLVLLLAALFLEAALPGDAVAQAHGWFWQNPRPQGNNLYGVFMLDPLRAVAVGGGGTILKTDDEGIHWTLIDDPAQLRSTLRSAGFYTAP